MRKYVTGILIGFLLSMSLTAYAGEVNMIGKVVDGVKPFFINGKRANQDVLIIQRRSYIPAKAASDLFGYDIDFINNEVHMQSKKFKGLTPFEQALKGMNYYLYKSNLDLNLGEETTGNLLEIDGNQYIKLTPAFSNHLIWDANTGIATVEYNNHTVTGQKTGVYVKDIDLIQISGYLHIRLSALGLKAVLRDNVLWIEKM